jgi:ubiquinone/menaquinone biosynthesis C-methylase UbiE
MKSVKERTKINEEKWDSWAKTFDDESWRIKFLRTAQFNLISVLEIKENISVLDIGCGTGWALGQISRLINNNGSFYGIDLSAKMIEKAKENFKAFKNFYFIKANAESIPLNNDFFDIIICTNSFHHYLKPDLALKEMHRLLKSDGRLYILDPTADSWYMKLLDRFAKLIEPDHVKMYSTEEFRILFSISGLKYLETRVTGTHEKIHIGGK